MNVFLKAFLFSIAVVLLISVCIGVAFYFMVGLKFGIGVGICAILVQIFGGYIWNAYRESKESSDIQTIVQTIKDDPTKFRVPIQLTCAYCHQENFAPVSLLEDNGFVCSRCKELNKVYIQYSTVRITKPISQVLELNEVDMEGDNTKRETTVNEPIEISNG